MKITQAIWEKKIREARGHYFKGKQHRMKVAQLAMECCVVKHGGNRNNPFSVARFAAAIGMNAHTLYNWMDIKKRVVDTASAVHLKGMSYDMLRLAVTRLSSDPSKKETDRVLKEIKETEPVAYRFDRYIKHMGTIVHNAMTPIKLMEIPTEKLSEVIKLATVIKNLLEKELEYRSRGTSGAKESAIKQTKKFNGGVSIISD